MSNKGQNGHKLSLFGPELGTFMHGFQNNFAQLLSSRRSTARNVCSLRLKFKVTLEGQMIK